MYVSHSKNAHKCPAEIKEHSEAFLGGGVVRNCVFTIVSKRCQKIISYEVKVESCYRINYGE